MKIHIQPQKKTLGYRKQKIAKNNKYQVENYKIAEKNFFKYLSGYDIVHSSVKFEDIS